MPVPTAAYLAGMRRLAAGVSIVTAELAGMRAGLTVTSACSLTAEPPRLLVCINRTAEAHDVIAGAGHFALNVLSAAQRDLADLFGGREDIFGDARFAQGRWLRGRTGAPILAGAAARFECRLVESLPVGGHSIFVGEVEAMPPLAEAAEPLVYHDRDYRRLVPFED